MLTSPNIICIKLYHLVKRTCTNISLLSYSVSLFRNGEETSQHEWKHKLHISDRERIGEKHLLLRKGELSSEKSCMAAMSCGAVFFGKDNAVSDMR